MARLAGGCHCGAVRFTAETRVERGMTCNCSICTKRGTILHLMPEAGFTLEQGEDHLTGHRFNRKSIHHLSCETCGILSFARGATPDGNRMIALNLPCVEGIDLKAMKVVEHDGASA